ncbi:hydroxymethylpyrimidine/phosphomethylpyrimidine kinase [bacterium]|nr:hydroxymethylpyrimidine/phosphomethylpyrimidine kinase [bacterium]
MPLAILSIAGSDPTGRAGHQKEKEILRAMGIQHHTVTTADTRQNDEGVLAVTPRPIGDISAGIGAVILMGIGAAKTGMFPSAAHIKEASFSLQSTPPPFLVVDPVIAPTVGNPFLDGQGVDALRTDLIPLATIITPNIPEASALSGQVISTRSDMERAARSLLSLGCQAILLKGGHLKGETSPDLLYGKEESMWFESPRKEGFVRGTGCAFSAALAGGLCKGRPIVEAVREAKNIVSNLFEIQCQKDVDLLE